MTSTSANKQLQHPLTFQEYGKTKVRVFTAKREASGHIIHDLNVEVLLQGAAFNRAYTEGDNSTTVATDTIKNNVHVVAQKHKIHSVEQFSVALCQHFLSKYSHIEGVKVTAFEDLWQRVGKSVHSFVKISPELRGAVVKMARGQEKNPSITSSINNLTVLKTTDSEWANFHRCEYRTLPDAKDRLLCTSVVAEWTFNQPYNKIDFNTTYNSVRETIVDVFATKYSVGVQKTIYDMCQVVLEKIPVVQSVYLKLPNIHYLLSPELNKLNIKNDNEVYLPTSEPSGLIIGRVERNKSKL